MNACVRLKILRPRRGRSIDRCDSCHVGSQERVASAVDTVTVRPLCLTWSELREQRDCTGGGWGNTRALATANETVRNRPADWTRPIRCKLHVVQVRSVYRSAALDYLPKPACRALHARAILEILSGLTSARRAINSREQRAPRQTCPHECCTHGLMDGRMDAKIRKGYVGLHVSLIMAETHVAQCRLVDTNGRLSLFPTLLLSSSSTGKTLSVYAHGHMDPSVSFFLSFMAPPVVSHFESVLRIFVDLLSRSAREAGKRAFSGTFQTHETNRKGKFFRLYPQLQIMKLCEWTNSDYCCERLNAISNHSRTFFSFFHPKIHHDNH